MRRRRSIVLVILVIGVAAGTAAACGSDTRDGPPGGTLTDDTITVASFDFAESELLAELYSQALEAGGFDVERAFHLGSRELVFPALAQGLVELVPDYVGSALQFVSLGELSVADGTAATHDALVDLLAEGSVRALEPAPAVDANAFVVRRETAAGAGLVALSDLARVAPELIFGGPPECAARPYCLVGLRQLYGIEFQEVLTLDAGGPLTRQALRSRDIDVALLFSTDPALEGSELVALEDDRRLQPAENVTPLVRVELVERWGASVVDRLDEVSRRLTTTGLRALNARVAGGEGGGDSRAVAASWLRAEGLR